MILRGHQPRHHHPLHCPSLPLISSFTSKVFLIIIRPLLIVILSDLIIPPLKAIHRELTVPELIHTFGVERHDRVPEYHLLDLVRREQDAAGNTRRMHFRAWNSTFLIELRPNHRLISPHMISVVREANRTTTFRGGFPRRLRTDCHFHGTVISHGGVRAAISDCHRLTGIIVMDDHFLVLQTVPERLIRRRRKRSQTEGPKHLVYKRNAALDNPLDHFAVTTGKIRMRRRTGQEETDRIFKEEVESADHMDFGGGTGGADDGQLFCDVSADNGTLSLLPPALANYTLPSAADLNSLFIFPQLDPITLEIGLFLDSMLFDHFRREFTAEPEQHLTDFSLALINNVHVLYQQPSLSPNLDIVIVRFELWKSQPAPLATELHRNGQAQSLLDSFCRHQARINPGTDLTDPNHWDHAVLLTGYDIYHTTTSVAGVAPVGRMCDELFACSLVEGLHLGRSFVLAHEMGHNMGMVHDGVQNQCGRSCCLMSAVNGAGKTTWSTCSVREFNAFLLQLDESGRGNCLRDPAESITSHDHLSDGRMPGQRFTADQQCSYFWGRDFQVEIPNGRAFEDICRILWCGNSGSTISTAHPALEGSWCGGQRWCHRGLCEGWHAEMGAFPTVVDGKWSEWTSSEKQCPITQCQITGSISLISQLRTCTAPAPNNGGRPCEGSNVRGIVCGGSRTICEGFTRKEFGDRLCSAILHDQIRPDRQLSGTSFLHQSQPCKIWCHVQDSELIRNKGQFPNGSPCGPGHYCVGGTCLMMDCDGRALVQSPTDCPSESEVGISNGNSRKHSSTKWEHWTEWSSCSATCGEFGVQKRERKCRSPVETGCAGKSNEVRACEPTLAPCEAAGMYSPWTEWSECQGHCGQRNGTRHRQRNCLGNAAECMEPLSEEEQCRRVNCAEWEAWTEWTECEGKCGKSGQKRRKRKCSVEGGEGDVELGCGGEFEQREPCKKKCPEHPSKELGEEPQKKGHWGEWQPCSVSCGIGFQFRERMCGEVPCAGSGKQARTCNVQDCSRVLDMPVWSEWSLWSACSRTCGQGVQQRFRRCLNGLCSSEDTLREQKRCVLGPCPQWTIWSPWTKCASCSVFETRKRHRQCVVKVANNDGLQEETELGHEACTGAPIEFDTCERSCVEEESAKLHGVRTQSGERIPRGGNWTEWSAWSPCSVTCGTGMRQRVRSCEGGKAEQCGDEALGTELEQCRKEECGEEAKGGISREEPDGRWSEWTEWGPCSESCGPNGRQSRTRSCRARLVFLCGDGRSREERPCEPMPPECPPASEEGLATLAPEGGSVNSSSGSKLRYPAWSDWSEWSACSCFSLTRYRRRFCRVLDPQLKGFCPGSIIDQSPCTPSSAESTQCSAIAGNWSAWSEWSACSQDCGSRGHRIRNRMCANPLPSNRGAYCIGFSFDQMPCDPPQAECRGDPIDGRWSEWSEWSQCSNPCVNGQRSRSRYCSNPRPKNGGKPCSGTDFELQACSEPALCQIYLSNTSLVIAQLPRWGPWSPWSKCTSSCGFSFRQRHRLCELAHGGGQLSIGCEGLAQMTELCESSSSCENDSTSSLLLEGGQWSEWSEWSSNCKWSACVSGDQRIDEEDQEEEEDNNDEGGSEGSGEEEEQYSSEEEEDEEEITTLAQALSTRTRTRACLTSTSSASSAPCFGPSSQRSLCPPNGYHCTSSTISPLMAHIWAADSELLQRLGQF